MTKQKTSTLILSIFLISSSVLLPLRMVVGQEKIKTEWHKYEVSFRVLNVASLGSSVWICGADEGVAVSSDGGQHWRTKHQTKDGSLLLNIDFANDKFGYATGTQGLFLTTEDAGETWLQHSAGSFTILQASFADGQHGLIRTPTSLLFTVDGGANWATVSADQNREEIKRFPYTFALIALDSKHMAVMLKEGAAQYNAQAILFTQDAGKSWMFLNIPNVTLYSFLRAQGKYWAIGTEVIHKDRPDGGYAVPVALYSSDGEKWEHSGSDLAACKPEMCVACNHRGCLSANGTITEFFSDKTSYSDFSSNRELTPKWGATEDTMCFVGDRLQCTSLRPASQAGSGGDPLPTIVAPRPLGAAAPQGPQCVACGLEGIFIDKKVQGAYVVKLVLNIAPNGTVTSVEAQGAPTPEIKSRIEQQAQQWIFEPYLKDGVSVSVKLNTSARVNVIKSR